MAAVAECTDVQAHTYREVRAATHACMEEAVVGRPISAMAARARVEFQERKLPWRSANRVGHGLGLDMTEPPSIAEDSDVLLEAGMVLTIEPAVVADHGFHQTEEVFVVTDSGYELLSPPAPPELWVVR